MPCRDSFGCEQGGHLAALLIPSTDRSWSRTAPDGYALKELPQPQPPVALGLWKVKPDPCIEVT